MATKLLVKTPKTSDGVTLKYNDKGQVEYKETILPISALKSLEAENSRRPEHFRHKFQKVETEYRRNSSGHLEEVVVNPEKVAPTSTPTTGKKKKAQIGEDGDGEVGGAGDNTNSGDTIQE